MRALLFGAIWISVVGCDASRSPEGSTPGNIVSDFAVPAFQGLAVRDHAEGAQVVERFQGPTGTYERCTIFTAVNGTRVRDATHFRDLLNAVAERGEELELGYKVNSSDCPAVGPTREVASQAVVSDFADPKLKGLVVRDHRDGVEVVASGATWHQPGTIFISVNGVPIRNAAHFRQLMNAKVGNEQVSLKLGPKV